MQRYFVEDIYEEKPTYTVSGDAFHHMVRVMRMSQGDQVFLAFANRMTIVAELTAVEDDSVRLKEIAKEEQEKELPIEITIASGYPKGDKLELIVQKGTELGAANFIGFPAQTSVVKWDAKKLEKKQERLEKIAQEAAEQSHRQVKPRVELFSSEKQLYQRLGQFDHVLVAYEESAKEGETAKLAHVLQSVKPGQKLLAIFGPEGGLTPKEIQHLQAGKAVICGLGPRILRTETAPFYLLSAASYHLELL